MNIVLTVVFGLLLLTVLVVVHEAGHMWAARRCGITVTEFAVGFGPAFARWHRRGTLYTLRPLPLGGFVAFKGETEEDRGVAGAFYNASPGRRIKTCAAGPLANVIFAYVAAVVFLCAYGDAVPVVNTIIPDSPAYQAGVRTGDVIKEMNGVRIDFALDLQDALSSEKGEAMSLTVERRGETLSFHIPYETTADGNKQVGLQTISPRPKTYSFGEALMLAFKWLWLLMREMFGILGSLIFTGQGMENLAGPVGTISIVGSAMQTGFENVLRMASLISLNLAVINILPLPALDGGKIVLYAIESVRKKPVSLKVESALNLVGFILLFTFVGFLTVQDIGRLMGG